jgi:mono/diheme cytochrome c family protein
LKSFVLLSLAAPALALSAVPGTNPYAEEVLQDEPAVYFRFEDGDPKQGAPVHNASTAKQTGPDGIYQQTVKHVAGPSAIGGRAASFDGAGSIEIPHHPLFDAEDLSVEFWFRTSQPFDRKFWPGSAALVTKATAGWGSGDWTILGGGLKGGENEGRVLAGVGPKDGDDLVLASGTGLNDDLFHHVVWTRTGTGRNYLYVDGTLCATGQDKAGTINNARPIQIGGDKGDSRGSFFKGEILAFAIYPHLLAKERVQAHFIAGHIDPRLPPPATRAVDFVRDIKPLFQKTCYKCHGLEKDKGGLSLATRARAMDGGDDGRVIAPGKSALSPLVRRIAALEEDDTMPPEGETLGAAQIGLIRAWIDQGAIWPESADEIDPQIAKSAEHWSFKPLIRPAVPSPSNPRWANSPIDAFILARLDQEKLHPTPPATKEALLRRVTFDLTGLPPSPDEIRAFVRDARPEAYADVVDRLLASPAYGERWARHWLDLVRYADSGGYETDIYYEQAWRYRDYVIRSFNEDKPYDCFLMEQVAGDELWPDEAEAMQDAVAVWTLGQWQNALDAFPKMLEYVRRTDQVVTFSEAMLGLSVGCANCHHHKYDPISQRDYFGLEAIFAASETWDKNRNRKAWGKGEQSSYRIYRHAPTPTTIHLLARGELDQPRGRVSPALPTFLPGGGSLPDGPDEHNQRRSRLARWLVSPQNPLTARVMANRVWQWHFGQALAPTPNDLGMHGLPPSHPELLDWLASELMAGEWRLKKLHRLILLSSTYRQSALREPGAIAIDPQNAWLAGFPRRRLEAEEVWDHLHATAGTLDRKAFGKPFVPKLSPEELAGIYGLDDKPGNKWPVTEEQNRRALYILNRRSFRFPFFEAFDPANNGASCPVRQSTTVPVQALTLMNNPTVADQARAMAGRLTRDAGTNLRKWLQEAWLLAYSREASDSELMLALEFINQSEAAHAMTGHAASRATALIEFCLAIMNTAEFIHTN